MDFSDFKFRILQHIRESENVLQKMNNMHIIII